MVMIPTGETSVPSFDVASRARCYGDGLVATYEYVLTHPSFHRMTLVGRHNTTASTAHHDPYRIALRLRPDHVAWFKGATWHEVFKQASQAIEMMAKGQEVVS